MTGPRPTVTYVSTTFASGRPPVTAVLRQLRERGVTCVELGSTHVYEDRLEQRLQDEFGDCSLLTHNFFPPSRDVDFVINMSARDDAQRGASIDRAAANVEAAARIGSRLHTLHPGFISAAAVGGSDERSYDFRFEPLTDQTAADAFARMLRAFRILQDRVGHLGVPLAIETQGTVTAPEHCLFQTPSEALGLTRARLANVGVNCNLGHLALASRVFGFDPLHAIDDLAPHIVAFELSHNDGTGDQHLPLVDGEWYWDVIADSRFMDVPMIVELRDVTIGEVCATLRAVDARRPRRGAERPPATAAL